MSASLDLYRGMIPAHAGVPDVTVELWLSLAASRHSAAAWGAVYAAGMVLWAASALDALVQTGQAGELAGGVCSPVTAKGKVAVAQEDSVYWAKYLDLRNSRAAGAPGHIGPSSATWPATEWPGWVV